MTKPTAQLVHEGGAIFARRMARSLTNEEIAQIGGGGVHYTPGPVYTDDWDDNETVSFPRADSH